VRRSLPGLRASSPRDNAALHLNCYSNQQMCNATAALLCFNNIPTVVTGVWRRKDSRTARICVVLGESVCGTVRVSNRHSDSRLMHVCYCSAKTYKDSPEGRHVCIQGRDMLEFTNYIKGIGVHVSFPDVDAKSDKRHIQRLRRALKEKDELRRVRSVMF
jgi:hypothetical protein